MLLRVVYVPEDSLVFETRCCCPCRRKLAHFILFPEASLSHGNALSIFWNGMAGVKMKVLVLITI